MEYKLRCADGVLYADEDKIMIHKTKIDMHDAYMGKRTIFYNDINSVEFKKSGLVGGYIKFILAGTDEHRRNNLFFGTKRNMRDYNSLYLIPGTNKKAIEIYNFILKKMAEIRNSNNGTTIINKSSNLDELKKLAELKEQGIINEEEFNIQKKKILESDN